MLEAMYTGDYRSSVQNSVLPESIARETLYSLFQYNGRPDIVATGCTLHALMYGLADKYDFPNVRCLAVTKFETCIKSSTITAHEVLSAAQVIYNTLPSRDDKLKKEVVYYCQTHMLELHKLTLFMELMADVDFAFDFGTKYSSRAHIWCAKCVAWTNISVSCSCGFQGLCGRSSACTNQEWSTLKCAGCKQQGHLLRDEPYEKPLIRTKRPAENSGGEPSTPPPTPVKRKH